MVSHLPNLERRQQNGRRLSEVSIFFVVKLILSFVSGISKSSVKSQNRESLN